MSRLTIRLLTLAILLAIIINIFYPIADALKVDTVIASYSPVQPLGVVNVSVKETDTAVIRYENGTLYQTTSQPLINQTITITPNTTILPHLYVVDFDYFDDGIIFSSIYVYNVKVWTAIGYAEPYGWIFRIANLYETVSINGSLGVYNANWTNRGYHYLTVPSSVLTAMWNGSELKLYANDTLNRIVYPDGEGYILAPSYQTSDLVIGTYSLYAIQHNIVRSGIIRMAILYLNKTIEGIKPFILPSKPSFMFDPTFWNGTNYIDPFNNYVGIPYGDLQRIPDNSTWFWVVNNAYTDGRVHFDWAPEGYAYYVYDLNGNLVGIYRNNETASLNGTYRVILAPAPPENTSAPYGGVLVYGLPPRGVVEFYRDGSIFAGRYEADGSGMLTVVLPVGNYTVKAYPPAWSPTRIKINLTFIPTRISSNYTGFNSDYTYVSWSEVLQSLGLNETYIPIEVNGTVSWGFGNDTLYLYKPNTTITILADKQGTPPPKPWSGGTTTWNVSALDIDGQNKILLGSDVFIPWTENIINSTDGTAFSAEWLDLNVTAGSGYNVTYSILVNPQKGTNDAVGIIIGYNQTHAIAVALRVGTSTVRFEFLDRNSVGSFTSSTGVSQTLADGKWYNVTIEITNTTVNVKLDGANLGLATDLPAGTNIAIGVYSPKTKSLWDFTHTVVIKSNSIYEEQIHVQNATYTPLVFFTLNYPAKTVTSPPVNITFYWNSTTFVFIEIDFAGVPVFKGIGGNLTLSLTPSEDGNFTINLLILDPVNETPIKSETYGPVDVDLYPPSLEVNFLGVMAGTYTAVFQYHGSGFTKLTASVNGTPANVTDEYIYGYTETLNKWYQLEVMAVDRFNRATIVTVKFFAFNPDEPVPVEPETAFSNIVLFFKSIFSPAGPSLVVRYLTTYSYGLFTLIVMGGLIASAWVRTKSMALVFSVSLIVGAFLGVKWASVIAGLAFAGLIYLVWSRSR